jgi:hypothetical protein
MQRVYEFFPPPNIYVKSIFLVPTNSVVLSEQYVLNVYRNRTIGKEYYEVSEQKELQVGGNLTIESRKFVICTRNVAYSLN